MKIIKIKSNIRKTVVKFDMLLDDAHIIQNVFFISDRYNTLSLSTQIGCPINCSFCNSGRKFIRNLTLDELLGQLKLVEDYLAKERPHLKLESIKLFGIGEPILNLDNVISFIKKISKKYSRISICTVGISNGINRLTKEGVDAELFISINGTSKLQRTKISDFFKRENFNELLQSIKDYRRSSSEKNKVQINYLILNKLNDSPKDMKRLGKMFGDEYKINLKRLCPNRQRKFKIKNMDNLVKLNNLLREHHTNVSISKSKGAEIYAAPGQLEIRKWK
jgi:23S rRNA (adenine2503-C2)-methyltransferase